MINCAKKLKNSQRSVPEGRQRDTRTDGQTEAKIETWIYKSVGQTMRLFIYLFVSTSTAIVARASKCLISNYYSQDVYLRLEFSTNITYSVHYGQLFTASRCQKILITFSRCSRNIIRINTFITYTIVTESNFKVAQPLPH